MIEETDIISKYITLMRNPVRKPLKGRKRTRNIIEMNEAKSKSTHFQSTGDVQKGTDESNDVHSSSHSFFSKKENEQSATQLQKNNYTPSFLKNGQSDDHKQCNNPTEGSNINSLKRVSQKTSFRESNRKYLQALVNKYSKASQKANKNFENNAEEYKSKMTSSDLINKCGHSTEGSSPHTMIAVSNTLPYANSEKVPTYSPSTESRSGEQNKVNNTLWPPEFYKILTKRAKQKRIKNHLQRDCAPSVESDIISKSVPPSPFDDTLPEPTNKAIFETKNECVSLTESNNVSNSLSPNPFVETISPNHTFKQGFMSKDSGSSSNVTLPKNTTPQKTVQKITTVAQTSCANASLSQPSKMLDGTVAKNLVPKPCAQEDAGSLSTYMLHLQNNTLPKNTMPKKRAKSLNTQRHMKVKDKDIYCSDPESLPKNYMPIRKSLTNIETESLRFNDNCSTGDMLKTNTMELITKVKSIPEKEIPFSKVHENLQLNYIPKKNTIAQTAKDVKKRDLIAPFTKKRESNIRVKKNIVQISNNEKSKGCNYMQNNVIKMSAVISPQQVNGTHNKKLQVPAVISPQQVNGTHNKKLQVQAIEDDTLTNSPNNDMLKGKRGKVLKPPERPFTVPIYSELPKNDIPRKSVTKNITFKSMEKLLKKNNDCSHSKDTTFIKPFKEESMQCGKQLPKGNVHIAKRDKGNISQELSEYAYPSVKSATNVLKVGRAVDHNALTHKPMKLVTNPNPNASIQATLNKNKKPLNRLKHQGASHKLNVSKEMQNKQEKIQSTEKSFSLSKDYHKNEHKKELMSQKLIDTKDTVKIKDTNDTELRVLSDTEVVACQHSKQQKLTIGEEIARLKQSTLAEDIQKILSKSTGNISHLKIIQHDKGREEEALTLKQLKCINNESFGVEGEMLGDKLKKSTEEKNIKKKKPISGHDKVADKEMFKNIPQKEQKLSQLQNTTPRCYGNLTEENFSVGAPEVMKSSSSIHKSMNADNVRKVQPPSYSLERQEPQRAVRETCKTDIKTPVHKQAFSALKYQKNASVSKDIIQRNKLQVTTTHSTDSVRNQTEKKPINRSDSKNPPFKKTVNKSQLNSASKSTYKSLQRNKKSTTQESHTKINVAEKIYKKAQGSFLKSCNSSPLEENDASSKLIAELQKAQKGLLGQDNNHLTETEFNKKETDKNINNEPSYVDVTKQQADQRGSEYHTVSNSNSQQTLHEDPSLNFSNQSAKYLNACCVKPYTKKVSSARSISPKRSLQNEVAQPKQLQLNTNEVYPKVTSKEFVQLPDYKDNQKLSHVNAPLQVIENTTEQNYSVNNILSLLSETELKEQNNKLRFKYNEKDDDYSNYNEKLLRFIPQEIIERSRKAPYKQFAPTLILPPRRSIHKGKDHSPVNREVVKQQITSEKQQSKNKNKPIPKVNVTEQLPLGHSYIYQQVKLTRAHINERKCVVQNEIIDDWKKNQSQIKRQRKKPTSSIQNPRLEEKQQSPTHKVSMHDWSKSDKNDTKIVNKNKPGGTTESKTSTNHSNNINQCHAADSSSTKVATGSLETAIDVNDNAPNSMGLDQINNTTNLSKLNSTSNLHVVHEPSTSLTSATPSPSNMDKDMIKNTTATSIIDGDRAINNKASETRIPKPFRLENDDEFELQIKENFHPQIKSVPEETWFNEINLEKITENTVNITKGHNHPRLVSLEQTHKGKPGQDVQAVRKAYRNSHLKTDSSEGVHNHEPGRTVEKGKFNTEKTTPSLNKDTINVVKNLNIAEKTDKLNEKLVRIPDSNSDETSKDIGAAQGNNRAEVNKTVEAKATNNTPLKMDNILQPKTGLTEKCTVHTDMTTENVNNLTPPEKGLETKTISTNISYNSTPVNNTIENNLRMTENNITQHQTKIPSNQTKTTITAIKTRLPISNSQSMYKDTHLKSKTKASVDNKINKSWSTVDTVQESMQKPIKPIEIKHSVDSITLTPGKPPPPMNKNTVSTNKTRGPIHTPNKQLDKATNEKQPKKEKPTASTGIIDTQHKNTSTFQTKTQAYTTKPLKAESSTKTVTTNPQTSVEEGEKSKFSKGNETDIMTAITILPHEKTPSKFRKNEIGLNINNTTTDINKVVTDQLSTIQDKVENNVKERKTSGGANTPATQQEKKIPTKDRKTKIPYRLEDDDEFEDRSEEKYFHLSMKPALAESWLKTEETENITSTTRNVPEGQVHSRKIAFKLPPHPEIKSLRESAWVDRFKISEISEKTGFTNVLQDKIHLEPDNTKQFAQVSEPKHASLNETNISNTSSKDITASQVVNVTKQQDHQQVIAAAATGKPNIATHLKHNDTRKTKCLPKSDNTNEDVLKIPCIDEHHFNNITTIPNVESKAIAVHQTDKSTKCKSPKQTDHKLQTEPFKSHIDKQELRRLIEKELERLQKSNELIKPHEHEPTIEVLHSNDNIPELPDIDSLLREPWPSRQPKLNAEKTFTSEANKLSQKTETTPTSDQIITNKPTSSKAESTLKSTFTKIHDSNVNIPQQIIDKIPVQGRDNSIKDDNNVTSKTPVNTTQENVPITVVPLKAGTKDEMKELNNEIAINIPKQIAAHRTVDNEVKSSKPLRNVEVVNSTLQSKGKGEIQQKELTKTMHISSENINTQSDTIYTKLVSPQELENTNTFSSSNEGLRNANNVSETCGNNGIPEKIFKSRKWCTINPNIEIEKNHTDNIQHTQNKEESESGNKSHTMNPAGETQLDNASQVNQNNSSHKATHITQKSKIQENLQKTLWQNEIKTYMKDLQQGNNFEQSKLKTSEQQMQVQPKLENEIKKPLQAITTNSGIHKKVTHEIQSLKQVNKSKPRCNEIKYPARLHTHSSEGREEQETHNSSNKSTERPSTSAGERSTSSGGKGPPPPPPPPPAASEEGPNFNKAKEGESSTGDQSRKAATQGVQTQGIPESKARDAENPVYSSLGKHFNSTTIRGRANVAKATFALIGLFTVYRMLQRDPREY